MATQLTKTPIGDIYGVLRRLGDTALRWKNDLSARGAAALRKPTQPAKAQRAGGRATVQRTKHASTAVAAGRTGAGLKQTLFAGLDAEQRAAFRRWAAMPDTRRISDERVQAWIDAGKPVTGRASATRSTTRPKAVPRRATPANR